MCPTAATVNGRILPTPVLTNYLKFYFQLNNSRLVVLSSCRLVALSPCCLLRTHYANALKLLICPANQYSNVSDLSVLAPGPLLFSSSSLSQVAPSSKPTPIHQQSPPPPSPPTPTPTPRVMSLSDSFAIPDVSGSDLDDVDSLPSTSTEDFDSDEEYEDAQREWETSIQQLELLLTMIIIPFAGKYFGRKFAYWSMSSHHSSRACLGSDNSSQAGQDTWSGYITSR